VKGPQLVTHRKKLADCDEPLQLFLDRVGHLQRLRVILWQLPPSLHKDLYRYDYSRAELAEWAARLRPLLPGRGLYAFFNNDYAARAPANAALLAELLAEQGAAEE
jgi:uncharacterized protein YecE (DUF72 family)